MIRSLRTKILLCALIPPALMLVVVAVVTLRLYEDATRDVVIQRDIELARISSARLAEHLSRYHKLLQSVAAGEDVRSMEPGRLASALEMAGDRLGIFDAGVFVYNSAGVAMGSWPSAPKREGTQFPVTSKFDEARKSLRPVYSDIFTDEATGEDVILIGAPVFQSDGEFNGMVAGMATLHRSQLCSTFAEVLELKAGHTGYAYLVGGKGRVIYHRYASLVGADMADTVPVAQVVRGKTGAVFAEDTAGNTVVSAFAPVPGTGWGIVTCEEWDVITRPIRGYNALLMGLFVMAGVVSSLLVLFVITRSLGPIRELTAGVSRIAEGEYGHSIVARSDDEVGRLAHAFNDMAARLKASFQKLYNLNTVLRTIRAVNQLITKEKNRDQLIQSVCDIFTETRSYHNAWIALMDNSGKLLTTAESGLKEAFLPLVELMKRGELPVCGSRALKGSEVVAIEDPSATCTACPLALDYTGRGSMTVRLEYSGKVYGTFSVSVPRDFVANEEEQTLFGEVADDIAFALHNMELEEERKRAKEELEKHREHLEELVKERTVELQKTINLMAGREVRMAELKKTIQKLRSQLEEAGMTPVADDPLKEAGREK